MVLKGEIPWWALFSSFGSFCDYAITDLQDKSHECRGKELENIFRPHSEYSMCQCSIIAATYMGCLSSNCKTHGNQTYLSVVTMATGNKVFLFQPNRTYYLEDPTGQSQEWVDTINQWLQKSKKA
jgi:hypothetical protein